ncbi:MAG TPA: cell division protein FtsZ, partial [Devosia sp.]|nr:cell division protein FtsZ [Devosia sp.]
LALSKASRVIQLGVAVTEGLGAGSHPDVGKAAAEESIDEINDHLSGAHMVFITAGMGGGTGTGAAPVVARAAREQGILTVGVVTKPFQFEGQRRMNLAESGIDELHRYVDTLLVIPNQNLFRVANEKTTFADAFGMADEVLYSGVACITDLMVKEGLINLDFADVRSVMRGMGKAMMGTGEANGEDRARHAAEAAISNPLLDEVSIQGARGLLISITGGQDMTLYEVDEAASRIREEVGADANIILGATFDDRMEGAIRVSVVATGTEAAMVQAMDPVQPHPDRAAITIERSEPVPQLASSNEEVGNQLEAAMASAVLERTGSASSTSDSGDVVVEPYVAETTPSAPMEEKPVRTEPEAPKAYVPRSASRPVESTRIPRVEEMPPVAQRAIAGAKGTDSDGANTPRGLFKRLASNVGINLGRGGEPESTAAEADDREAQKAIEAHSSRSTARNQPGAAGNLDRMGRSSGADSKGEQIEIPAFLRKHG